MKATKGLKKLFALLLALCMVLQYVPATAFAAEEHDHHHDQGQTQALESVQVSSDADYVAKVGDTLYTSFADALNNWTDGTLTLLKDVTYSTPFTVETEGFSGARFVLNLNGMTLDMSGVDRGITAGHNSQGMYLNAPTLTITGGGTLKSKDVAVVTYVDVTLDNVTVLGRIVSGDGGFSDDPHIRVKEGSTVDSTHVSGYAVDASGFSVDVSGSTIKGEGGIRTTTHVSISKTEILGSAMAAVCIQYNAWGCTVTIDADSTIAGGNCEFDLSNVIALDATIPDGTTWRVYMEEPGQFLSNFVWGDLVSAVPGYVVDGDSLVPCDHSESEHTTVTDSGNGKTHTYTCTVCGMEGVSEDHTFAGSDTCICGSHGAVTITKGETVSAYLDFGTALENWEDGTTLTLLSTVFNEQNFSVNGKSVILDLNGNYLFMENGSTLTVGTDQQDAYIGPSSLTIQDATGRGYLGDRSIRVYDTLILTGGNLHGGISLSYGKYEGSDTYFSTGSFTMTGGSVNAQNNAVSVNKNTSASISHGALYGANGAVNNGGTLSISGDAEIYGEDIGVYAYQGETTISGSPIIQNGSLCGIYVNIPDVAIVMNTQPSEGQWRVHMYEKGTFATAGEGVTLDPAKFQPAVPGFVVELQEDGSLALVECEHSFVNTTTCVCGAEACASISDGENFIGYEEFSSALDNWEDGTTLTLHAFVYHDQDISVNGKSVTLDLNGYELDLDTAEIIVGVWDSEDYVGSSSLTIQDATGEGVVSSTSEQYLVCSYDKFTLTGGNLVGSVSLTYCSNIDTGVIITKGDFTMTGGKVVSIDTKLRSALYVENNSTATISGGTLEGRHGIENFGMLTITGEPVIIGSGSGLNPGAAIFNSSGEVSVSGSPTFKDGGLGTFFAIVPVVLNTQPAKGQWRVCMDVPGTFAKPGQGVTLDPAKFQSLVVGYAVKLQEDGSLALGLCEMGDHTDVQRTIFVPNTDGQTHSEVCAQCYYPLDKEDHDFGTSLQCKCGLFAADVVASITDGETVQGYTDISNAVSNWTDGTTLTLLADYVIPGEGQTIQVTGKNQTLDLNGRSITRDDYYYAELLDVKEGAELTVIDSSEEKTGTIRSNQSQLMTNRGTMVIKGGNYEVGETKNYGTMTVEGGTFSTGDNFGIINRGDLTISGGSFTTENTYPVFFDCGNALTITGGTFVTADYRNAIHVNANQDTAITVSGGSFTGKNAISISAGGSSTVDLYLGAVECNSVANDLHLISAVDAKVRVFLTAEPVAPYTTVYYPENNVWPAVFGYSTEEFANSADYFLSGAEEYYIAEDENGDVFFNTCEHPTLDEDHVCETCGSIPTFDVQVAGIRVTVYNMDDILADLPEGTVYEGTVSYDYHTHTLTMENVDIDIQDYSLVSHDEDELTIVLKGENHAKVYSQFEESYLDGIHSSGLLNVTGSGSLALEVSGYNTTGIRSYGDMTFCEGTTVEIKVSGQQLVGISAHDDMEIEAGATVIIDSEIVHLENAYTSYSNVGICGLEDVVNNGTVIFENEDLVVSYDGGQGFCGENAVSPHAVNENGDMVCLICNKICSHPESARTTVTDNEDGATHTYSCTICGASITEEHDYVNYICVCGAQAVVQVGEDFCTSLEDAKTLWDAGETLTLLADVTIPNALYIWEADQVLDLNGKTLTGTSDVTVFVIDEASVTIQDSSEASTGKIAAANYAVYNNGIAVLNGGTLMGKVINYETMTMNGGSIFVTQEYQNVDNRGTLTINGGSVYSKLSYAIYNSADLVINGGTFTSDSPDLSTIRTTSDTDYSGSVAISGCTINGLYGIDVGAFDATIATLTLGDVELNCTEDLNLYVVRDGQIHVELTQEPEKAYTVYADVEDGNLLFGYSSDTVAASLNHYESVADGVLLALNEEGVVYAYACPHSQIGEDYICQDCGIVPVYELYIFDEQVTLKNCSDILGDGTFSFDPATITLTMNNTTLDGVGNAIESRLPELTVCLVGENAIVAACSQLEDGAGPAGVGIDCKNLTLTGDGSLTITTSGETNYGIYTYGLRVMDGVTLVIDTELMWYYPPETWEEVQMNVAVEAQRFLENNGTIRLADPDQVILMWNYEEEAAFWGTCGLHATSPHRIDGDGNYVCLICNEICDHTGSIHTTGTPAEEGHTYSCSVCGAPNLAEQHSGGTDTCMSGAACEICSEVYGQKNPANHTGNNHTENAAEATCGAPGYTGDYVCECGETVEEGEEIPATGDHHYETEVEGTRVAATCMATGSVTMACECGAEEEQELPIDPDNHTGNNTLVDVVDATCGAPGYTGDSVCECGVTVEEGEEIPATGDHDFQDGECVNCGAEDPEWVEPTEPTEPEDPTEPTEPEDPTEPTEPEDPTEPTEPEDPTEPPEPEDPTEPTEPEDPSEPTEPEDPSEPTEPEDPTEPTEPEDPTEPTEPEDPSEPTEPEDPSEPTEPEDPEEPAAGDVIRLAGKDRYLTGFAVADQLKVTMGVDKFQAVVVAYGQNFPDALTGSYLASVKNAPILLTETAVDASVIVYIQENVVRGGQVYILGGTAAVSQGFEDDLNNLGFQVKRLKGAGRFETNLAILAEAGVNTTDEILIATGKNYADSLSASATGLPMLLVDKTLTDAQKEFLEGTSKKFVILGGTGAVSAEVEAELDAIGDVTRVKGASRYGTSVEIAKRYFTNPNAVVLAYAEGFPDGLCGGPLAIAMGAPMILTSDKSPQMADDYVQGITTGVVTGGTARISDDTVRNIFELPASTPIVKP